MIRDQLVYGLGRLAAVARQRDWAVGEQANLTPTQGDILRLLAARPHGMRPGAVAAQVSTTMATASDAITALVRKGLVEKQPSPEDARAVVARLTPQGSSLVEAVTSGFDAVADMLGEDDQRMMLAIVSRAILELQRAGQIAPLRHCWSCRYFLRDAYSDGQARHHCNFVDAPLDEANLRLDCPEHEEANSTP
jgi:DNA-binding MarR family transcriptional regulator